MPKGLGGPMNRAVEKITMVSFLITHYVLSVPQSIAENLLVKYSNGLVTEPRKPDMAVYHNKGADNTKLFPPRAYRYLSGSRTKKFSSAGFLSGLQQHPSIPLSGYC